MNIQKTYRLSSKTGTNKQKYQVVKELRRKYALKDLLLISGLPKSVYYYYEHQNETDKYHDIKILISEIFEASNKTYGYRRIKFVLQNFYQVKIAYKTVVKLMKELHIVCKVRKKRYRYISQISNKITLNLLKRDFKKDEPNIAVYRNYLKKSSFVQSMSAKGNAYDNAVIESFFGTLKCETVYLQKG